MQSVGFVSFKLPGDAFYCRVTTHAAALYKMDFMQLVSFSPSYFHCRVQSAPRREPRGIFCLRVVVRHTKRILYVRIREENE